MIRLALILAGWLVFLALGTWLGTEIGVAPQVARPGVAVLIKSFLIGFGVGSMLLTGLKLRLRPNTGRSTVDGHGPPGIVGMATFLVVALAMGDFGISAGIVFTSLKMTHIVDHDRGFAAAGAGLASTGFFLSLPFSTWLARRWPRNSKWS